MFSKFPGWIIIIYKHKENFVARRVCTAFQKENY